MPKPCLNQDTRALTAIANCSVRMSCGVLQCGTGCCSVLQCVAMRCNVLQCVAVCCNVLQCVAECCSVAMWCSALQYVAVCCSVLQCVAMCRSVSQCVAEQCECLPRVGQVPTASGSWCVAVCCNVLHCVAVCCSVLQCECAAVCCSVLQCVLQLQCVAVCCSVLQCVAVCCSVSQCVVLRMCTQSQPSDHAEERWSFAAAAARFSVNIAQTSAHIHIGWLRLVVLLKLQVSLVKEPYKRDYILQKRPIISRSLHIVATPHVIAKTSAHIEMSFCIRSHRNVIM